MSTTKGLDRARERYALDLREAVKRATTLLSEMPEVRRASLRGSDAGGRQDLFTDLDLLVIMETEAGVVERLQRLYSLLALPVDYDVVCYTPGEWEDLHRAEDLAQRGGYYLACFLAQQVAEKALKAFLYTRGLEIVLGHSVER